MKVILAETATTLAAPREKYLWNMIYKNWIAQYETELSWIRQLRTLFCSIETGYEITYHIVDDTNHIVAG